MKQPSGDPQFHAVYSYCHGPGCMGGMTSYPRAGFSSGVSVLSNANVPNLLFCVFHSQEALSVFKEAIQKMPRQFAPQSLYNMMGKSCSCFRTMSVKKLFLLWKKKVCGGLGGIISWSSHIYASQNTRKV